MKHQADYDRKMKKMERQNARKKAQQKLELKKYLQSQINEIELERQREADDRAEYARDIKRSIQEDSIKAKEKARITKEKNRQYRQDIIAQMKWDANRRYEAAADQMPESEMVLNRKLLQGKDDMKKIF